MDEKRHRKYAWIYDCKLQYDNAYTQKISISKWLLDLNTALQPTKYFNGVTIVVLKIVVATIDLDYYHNKWFMTQQR